MNSRSVHALIRIVSGVPTEAMEAAKEIIGKKVNIESIFLVEIARAPILNNWARVASIYSLGLLGYRPSVPVLTNILRDQQNHWRVRAHAAEALGNLRDSRPIPVLEKVLMSRERSYVKVSCLYALSEIGTRRACAVLEKVKLKYTNHNFLKQFRSMCADGRSKNRR